MDDDLDPYAHDQNLLDEIHLLTELVIAATNTTGRLTQDRIDDILQVEPIAADTAEVGADEGADSQALPRQRGSQVAGIDQEHARS